MMNRAHAMRMGPMFLRGVLAEKSQPVFCRPAAVQAILAPRRLRAARAQAARSPRANCGGSMAGRLKSLREARRTGDVGAGAYVEKVQMKAQKGTAVARRGLRW